jgi:hypothetical protein
VRDNKQITQPDGSTLTWATGDLNKKLMAILIRLNLF